MKENWREHWNRWYSYSDLDKELLTQLEAMERDEQALEDCFYKHIEFGTGGIRGELGPGINRINLYTIRKATAGLARFVCDCGNQAKQSGVAIAYDSRFKSKEFAMEAAKVLGHHGIRVYVFDRLCPTPLLSFAVRKLKTIAGIVITASHNPPEYNGFKVYGSDGGQITLAVAKELMLKIDEAGDELTIEFADENKLIQSGLLTMVGEQIMEDYLQKVKSILETTSHCQNADPVRIVFTPLHGTTLQMISLGLKQFGYDHVTIVDEQAVPDPLFSTVVLPNPEEPQAFELAIKDAMETNADMIIATDPDGDRLGVATLIELGKYKVLSGNQIGALLLHFILSQKHKKGMLPKNGVVLKTIVTSELGRSIASDFGLMTVETLTGFKYIGEKIGEYEKSGEHIFEFGYEESYGYLIGDFVRDKDAVQAALLMADVCSFYKSKGMTLYDALLQLFTEYGTYCEDLFSITLKGKSGMEQMSYIMSSLRERPLSVVNSLKVRRIEDYLEGQSRDLFHSNVTPIELPSSDTLKYHLEDGSWFCVRPSGTEPKIKIYFGVKGSSLEDSSQRLATLRQFVTSLIETL